MGIFVFMFDYICLCTYVSLPHAADLVESSLALAAVHDLQGLGRVSYLV